MEEMTAPLSLEERSFNQLLLMSVFDKISGLVLGKPEKGDSGSAPFSCDELLLEMLGPRHYPVISNFDCGHTHPMITLGQDLLITLEADAEAEAEVRITLNEAMAE